MEENTEPKEKQYTEEGDEILSPEDLFEDEIGTSMTGVIMLVLGIGVLAVVILEYSDKLMALVK